MYLYRGWNKSVLIKAEILGKKIMEMKPVKLMVLCPFRMANLFDCCKHTIKNVVPLFAIKKRK